MKRLQRAAVLVSLIESLRENGSWCGGTNIQKAAYFLQEALEVPLEFEFTLYKHGPYSFDLTDELTALRADSILELQKPNPQYGPSYVPGELRNYVLKRFPKTVKAYRWQLDFVGSKLGGKNVMALERLATALYVRKKMGDDTDVEQRAEKITKLKPHISFDKAKQAVEEVDGICLEVEAGN